MKQFYFFILVLITQFTFSQNFTDTKGELQISAAGIATYNLPIATPPSIKGVAPIINLTYSSGVRGGIAGQGWNINSISAISRIATRRDIDGFVDGVDFDADDKLSLDGQRLLIKSGTYWANASTYETEYKSNTRIELKIEGSVMYFIVTAPDGSRSWYGSKGSGSMQNSVSVNSWYIVHYEDVNENFIDYTYKTVTYKNSSQLYIDTIVFSGNAVAGIAAQDKIVFVYDDAKRVERDYLGGVPIYATKILKSVEVYANNVLFRKYTLAHTADTELGYERVTSIKEVNAQGEESNPVVFEYNTSPITEQRKVKTYSNNLNFSETQFAGDFDGDGQLDFVGNRQVFTKLFNGDTGNAPINLPNPGGTLFSATTLSNNKLNQFQSFVFAKETLTTIEFRTYNLSAGAITLNQTKTINFNNLLYHDTSLDNPNCTGFYIDPLIVNAYSEGDFNGDGISEVLVVSNKNAKAFNSGMEVYDPDGIPSTNCYTEYTNEGEEFHIVNLDQNASTTLGENGFLKIGNSSLLEGDNRIIADFNGDSKSDILVINYDKSYRIISFKQLTAAPWLELEVIGSGVIDKYSQTKQMLLGDYNGDGKTDIMLPTSEGGSGQTEWNIYYSNPKPAGGDFFIKETHNIVEYWPNTGLYYSTQTHFSTYYAMDINNDGKSDIVRVWRKYYKPLWTINNHNTSWQVTAFANNIGKVGVSGFTPTYDSTMFDTGSSDIPIPVASNYRYDKSNSDLVIVRGHNKEIEYYQFNKDVATENRLKSVTEASGNIKQTIDYATMEASDGMLGNATTDFYSSGDAVSYPNIEVIRNSESYLVSKLTATINGVSKYQNFRYRGYILNFNYGTVGYTRTTRSSWYLSDSDPKNWITQYNDTNLRGANTITWTSTNGSTVFDVTPSDLVSTKTNAFATYLKGGGDVMSPSAILDNLTISEIVTSGQSYKANNSIVGKSKINDDLSVIYQAPQVILRDGFIASATNNSKFTAIATTTQGGNNAPLSNNGVYNVLLSKQTTVDHLSGIKTETVFSYDGVVDSPSYFGLETRSVTKKYNGSIVQGTTTIDTEYDNNPTGTASAYYIGRPKKVNSTENIYTGDTRTSEESYNYTGSNLTRTEKKGHNTYAIVEDMTYDLVGNLLTKTVSAPTASPAPAARKIVDEYDVTKRFVIKKINHQNFVTIFAYNTLGQVIQSTNYLGVVSDFTFDNWGKLTKTKTTGVSTTPLETTITYSKLSNGGYLTTSENIVGDNDKSITQYDVLGRAIITTTKGLVVNSTISNQVVYDGLGRKIKVSEPYFSSPTRWVTYEYDYLMRPTTITQPSGRIQTLLYPPGLTTTSIDDGKTTTATVDALGNKIQTTDPGGTISFIYYANGQLKESNYEQHKVNITIDGWGNKIAMTDPNAGTYTYSYDAFGQLITETTPKGKTDTTYDPYGKIIKKKVYGEGADIVTDYQYNGFAQLTAETSKSSTGALIDTFSYTYDNLHRIVTNTESNASFVQTKTVSYDDYGRPITGVNATQELTSGLTTNITTKNVYNTYNGMMDKLTDSNDAILWQLNTANEKMQSLTETLGNGITITNVYESNGYFTSQKHVKNNVSILENTYSFNAIKGTLNNRQNVTLGTSETFTYDNLDRLTSWTNPLTNTLDSNSYDNRGRITENNKLGRVTYNANFNTGIYQKKDITLTTGGLAYYNELPKQVVTYNMFKSPISINESDKGSTAFTYNSHLSRQIMKFGYQLITPGTIGTYSKTKNYTDDGTVEIIKSPTEITIRTFVGGDAYGAPLYLETTKTISSGAIVDKKYYLHRDYLGSIVAISDATGIAVERRQFDAWGNLVKLQKNGVAVTLPTNGTGAGLMMLDRGYTGHEHLAEVGLIQMNGRLYDPVLRSFLMPDNFIQQPENTQSYNRYAYVLNNPLMYTDPSGEYGIEVAIAVGMGIAALSYTMTALLTDVPFSIAELAKTVFVGAVTSGCTFGIGEAANSLFGAASSISKAAFQAITHGSFQGMLSIGGGKFWSGFAAGAISSITSSAFSWDANGAEAGLGWGSSVRGTNVGMIAFGAVSGGAGSVLAGGNFWQGAATGLVVSALNHALHSIPNKKLIKRLDEDLDKEFGNGGNDNAPANQNTINRIMDLRTFKALNIAAGANVSVDFIDSSWSKDGGSAQFMTLREKNGELYTGSDDGLIDVYRSAFSTYRETAGKIIHEFGHAISRYNGFFANSYKKYGDWNKSIASDEKFAYLFQDRFGFSFYQSNSNLYLPGLQKALNQL